MPIWCHIAHHNAHNPIVIRINVGRCKYQTGVGIRYSGRHQSRGFPVKGNSLIGKYCQNFKWFKDYSTLAANIKTIGKMTVLCAAGNPTTRMSLNKWSRGKVYMSWGTVSLKEFCCGGPWLA